MNRGRRALLGTAAAASIGVAGKSRAAGSPQVAATPWFPYGVHMYREPHLPMSQLLADLPLLKRLGFSMIKIQESWAYDERVRGKVDLEHVERLIKGAKDNSLRVFFGVTMEQAPLWLWKQFPDAAMVFEDGLQNVDPAAYVVPGDGKPGPCWHHAGVRQAATRFLQALVKRLSRFDNIAVWNLWQEVGFYSWSQRAGHGKFCYCAHTVRAFQRWLAARYQTIDRLNDAWRTPYVTFGDVQPPRVFHMVPATVDWRAFMDAQYFADALAWKARVFQQGDPLQRPVMTHVSRPTTGSSQEFAYANAVQVFGSSVYPDWSEGDWDSPLMALEQTRGAANGKPFWAAELQSGPIGESLGLRRAPTASDVRRWLLSCLAMGAKGICFWNHRPEPLWNEAHGFGLLEHDGTVGQRAQAAADTGKAIAQHAQFFLNASATPAPLGIVVSQDVHHIAEATGGDFQKTFKAAHRGAYRLAWDAAVPVDFVNVETLGTQTTAVPRVLWMPFGIAMSGATVSALQRHVENGGHLILEAGAGHLDAYGVANAGFMSATLLDWLGVDAHAFSTVDVPTTGTVAAASSKPERVLNGEGVWKGTKLSPAHVLQPLSARAGTGAVQTILRDGDKTYGLLVPRGGRGGLVAIVGTHPGVTRQLYPDKHAAGFVAALLGALGVTPDAVGTMPRRRLVWGKREAWFLFNTTKQTQTVSLTRELAGRTARTLDGTPVDTVSVADVACVFVDLAT